MAASLQKRRITVRPRKGNFFPQREQKTAIEVKKISAALLMAEVGMAEAIQVLHVAKVGQGGRLMYRDAPLTSEKLRAVIDTAIIQATGLASHTIVAGGKQGCDPHEPGYGPLRANEPIILDIFPRSQSTGYFGDITRTVVRGKATEAGRKLWETCLAGQAMALEKMKPGNQGAVVHESIKAYFAEQGYPTEIRDGRWQGFFHGTGHGLGLEIHEAPRFAAATFLPGQVLTVEPGIYIPGIGGVRHEDVAFVTRRGPKLLTKAPKPLEI